MTSKCQVCGQSTDDGYYNWFGPPFSMRTSKEICTCCLTAIKPKVFNQTGDDAGIAIIGTYDGDIYTLSEMVEEGFDKEQANRSLRVVGKYLGLSPYRVKQKLAK